MARTQHNPLRFFFLNDAFGGEVLIPAPLSRDEVASAAPPPQSSLPVHALEVIARAGGTSSLAIWRVLLPGSVAPIRAAGPWSCERLGRQTLKLPRIAPAWSQTGLAILRTRCTCYSRSHAYPHDLASPPAGISHIASFPHHRAEANRNETPLHGVRAGKSTQLIHNQTPRIQEQFNKIIKVQAAGRVRRATGVRISSPPPRSISASRCRRTSSVP